MNPGNYVSPDELLEIREMCDALNAVWKLLTEPSSVVGFDSSDMHIELYDANGESLGFISWSDEGAAYFPWGADE